MVTVARSGAVWICDLGSGENRLDIERLSALHTVFDEIDETVGPAALVTTGSGRFYSNGLSPEAFSAVGYLDSFQHLLSRMLVSSTPTVAALQGHTYAGGLLMALAHDRRVMNVNHGFACLPEVKLGFPFLPGMSALIQSRLTPAVAHEAMVLARRYTAEEAKAAGVVDEVACDTNVLESAITRAAELAPLRGDTFGAIKATMYGPVTDLLTKAAIS